MVPAATGGSNSPVIMSVHLTFMSEQGVYSRSHPPEQLVLNGIVTGSCFYFRNGSNVVEGDLSHEY